MVILPETAGEAAIFVADRIRQKASEFYLERRVNGRPFELTASAGVASFPEDADGPEELAANIRSESARFGPVIRKANMVIQ